MGITIHYFTEVGRHLDPATAAAQFERAVGIAASAAERYGWEPLGRQRREDAWYLEHAPEQASAERHGTVRSAAWNPSPGCETFALEWVEGTGVLPYCFVKTQFADRRAVVHAQICDLLETLNRDAFGGRLVVHDEGGYLPGRSVDALAKAFGENEALIRALLGAARRSGLTVASPLDEQDARADTDTGTHPG